VRAKVPQIRWFAAFRVSATRAPRVPRVHRPESIVVRAADGDGAVGWGESVVPEGCDRGWAAIEDRAETAVLGRDWDHPEELTAEADFGSPHASAAIDIACWDLWCRARGVPLAHALGGSRTSVVAGARLTAERQLDTLLVEVNRYVSAGYSRVTLRVCPGWDIEPVRAVRNAFPGLALQVDAAGAYTDSPADLAALEALDSYRLVALERPFAAGDLDAHARLQDRLTAAVAPQTGDLAALDTAIATGAGRALVLRPGALGGLSTARRAHDRAAAAGWDLWCRGSLGLGVGQAAAVALAGLPGCTLPSDLTELRPAAGVVSPPVQSDGGVVAVPLTQSGLGHQIDEGRVRALATEELRIPA
jgi:O-succinylbenzoate synthase